jgi:hypothetical protein
MLCISVLLTGKSLFWFKLALLSVLKEVSSTPFTYNLILLAAVPSVVSTLITK